MEYDLSKIKTEKLRRAVEDYNENADLCCKGIACSDCPFDNTVVCDNYGTVSCGCNKYIYKLFKEELIRREKMENKMPELEVGMIVELEFKPTKGRDLYILLKGDGELQPILPKGGERGSKLSSYIVTKIYENQSVHYSNLFQGRSTHDLTLIWSKKSDKDIKIEELEKTIKKAQEQIQELKG